MTDLKSKRPFLSVTFLAILGRSGGFLIPFFVALIYGANISTDAFLLAYGIMTFFSNIAMHLFESALLPYLMERKKDPPAMLSLSVHIFNLTLPLMVGLYILIGILMPFILTRWSGWKVADVKMVEMLFLEMLPLLLLGTWISSRQGILYAHQSFWFPSISPLIRSVIMIVCLFTLHSVLGIHAATAGFVLGEVFRWAFCRRLFNSVVNVLSVPKAPSHFTEVIKDFSSQAFLQVLALFAFNLIPVTDQFFASRLQPGSISLYSYSERLLLIPSTLFLTSILPIFLSSWSQEYYHGSKASFRLQIQKDSRTVFGLSLTGALCLWFFRAPLVHVLFSLTDLSREQIQTMADIFGWLALGLMPGVMLLFYGRVLFILKKSNLYCFQSWIAWILNLILDFILVQKFGLAGIAMATTFVYGLTALAMAIYVRRSIECDAHS